MRPSLCIALLSCRSLIAATAAVDDEYSMSPLGILSICGSGLLVSSTLAARTAAPDR